MATTRNPFLGNYQQNTFATGAKRYGANQSLTATSGQLSKDGYEERRRKQLERKRAIERRAAMMQRPGGMVDPTMGGMR